MINLQLKVNDGLVFFDEMHNKEVVIIVVFIKFDQIRIVRN
jgi:hypothetical protein